MSIWVLVADSSIAHVYSAETPVSDLEEVTSLEHPEGRLHDRDLTSDLPARSFDSVGGGRHAMEQPVDPKRAEAIRFAQKIAAYLEDGRIHGRFTKLYVVAAPAFLGLLRDQYSASLAHLVTGEIGKRLTQCRAREVRAHLPKRL